jgi:Domain of unknown function (DUF4259)
MGAWGMGPFDNDAALDFLGDLTDGPAGSVADGLRSAMNAIVDETGYLDGSDVDAAVAAACLIAARIDPSVPVRANGKTYLDQLTFTVDDQLRHLAARVFARAFDATGNEWHDLWAESGALAEVEAALSPYRTVVGA